MKSSYGLYKPYSAEFMPVIKYDYIFGITLVLKGKFIFYSST